MEVTPQVLHDVTFRSQRRGYDCDQVDDFLERIEAGVADLQLQLADANRRAEDAEGRAAELETRLKKAAAQGGGDAAAEESLRRTLVLAQRTADAAIQEAEEYAARVRAEADEHAARVQAEIDARVARAVREAEDEAKRGAVETRQRLVEEIIELEATRDGVRADVVTLEHHHDEQRLRLRAAVTELQRMLDDPASLRGMPMPELREVALPDDLRPAAGGALDADEAATEVVDEDAGVDEGVDEETDLELDAELEEIASLDDLDADGEDDVDADIWGPAAEDERFDEDDARSPVAVDAGPPTEALHIPEGPEGDDAYLAELRKAMLDDDNDELPPLPPLSDEPLAGRRPRSRFGRRR